MGCIFPKMYERASKERELYLQGVGLALIAVLLWSGNYVIARGLNNIVTPISLAFFRWLFATVLLFPIAYKSLTRQWKVLLPHWKHLGWAAITGVSLFNTFIYIAGKYTTATNLALIGTTAAPLFVLALSVLFFKGRTGVLQLAGALICLGGILLLLTNGVWENLLAFRFSTGDLWMLGAALSFAVYTLLVRKKPKELSSTTYLFAVFFLGTFILLPAWLVEQTLVHSFEWTWSIFLVFLYLGLGTSVISFLAWNGAIHRLGPTRTALFGNLIPVFSSIEAVLILGERFTWVTIASMLVILLGIVVANWPSKAAGSKGN